MGKLKVLILHPAFTNPESYGRAIRIYSKIEAEGLAEFYFVRAPMEVGLSDIIQVDAWYDGPSLRWFDSEILGPLAAYSRKSEKATIDTIQQEIGKNGPYDALFGYSEGGVAIAVYLFKHWEAQKAAGVTEVEFPVRGAVFMGAVPPLINIDGEGDPALLTSEMTGEIFNIDTLHIVGSQDGIIDYCTELYRLCDEERAVLYNTGRGHVFSRNPQVGEKVQQQLRKFLQGIADSKSG